MLKKITVDDLRLGMHLHELCGAWLDHPFWKTKFVLRDPEDLRKLQGSGVREVWIDIAKGGDVDPPAAPAAARRDPSGAAPCRVRRTGGSAGAPLA
jgi:hypothetical protein